MKLKKLVHHGYRYVWGADAQGTKVLLVLREVCLVDLYQGEDRLLPEEAGR